MDSSLIDSDQSLPLSVDEFVDIVRREALVTTDSANEVKVHLPPERWPDIEEIAAECGWEVAARAEVQHKLTLEPAED